MDRYRDPFLHSFRLTTNKNSPLNPKQPVFINPAVSYMQRLVCGVSSALLSHRIARGDKASNAMRL